MREPAPPPRDACPAVAVGQGGAFTRRQARAEGWSDGRIARRIRSGAWRRLAGRALVVTSLTVEPRTLAWAVHLTWPDAVASHSTAAALHGFPGHAADVPEATSTRRRRCLTDLRAYHDALEPCDVVRLAGRAGPRLTTPRRTALDLLATVDPPGAEALLAWAVSRRILTRGELARAARERCGRPGTPQLLRLLRQSTSGALGEAERRMHRLLRRAGIDGWQANALIRHDSRVVAVVDLLFADARVVVEVDGWATHSSHDAFVRDRERQNRLVNAGYRVLRFTWEDVVHREAETVEHIRAALAGTP
jgi:very-short-patch-repair endonuclease